MIRDKIDDPDRPPSVRLPGLFRQKPWFLFADAENVSHCSLWGHACSAKAEVCEFLNENSMAGAPMLDEFPALN